MHETTTPIPLVGEGEAVPAQAGPPPNDGNARAKEYPEADFLEPVEWGWTEAGYEVRQAVKKYSEQAHADH